MTVKYTCFTTVSLFYHFRILARDTNELAEKLIQVIYRVGRQGTLLCKEINIGYLKRLYYLPLRGENEVNTSVFIAVFLQN